MSHVAQSLKVLVAEDSPSDRLILESIITQAGHQPILVDDGLKAVRAFRELRPDMVLLDVMMPRMGGMEAASTIRELSAGELVPILFLTSLTDANALVECLESGGDDFIPKPYNAVVLKSKLKAFGRIRELNMALVNQKKKIEENHKKLIHEQTVARQVFDRIAHTGSLEMKNIRHYLSPMAVFNGDVMVAEISPRGTLAVFLGDFTGHGLPAAIGTLPLASTFYGMVRKGYEIGDILVEINSKLHEILPVGLFCCAHCIEISFTKKRFRVWSGGLPDLYIYRCKENRYEPIKSTNLPLGVLSRKQFNSSTRRIDLEYGDLIYMWSDGILESRNPAGEMFTEERLLDIMRQMPADEGLFDHILHSVHDHVDTSEKDDDISLIEIAINDIDLSVPIHHGGLAPSAGVLSDWKMDFELGPSSLKAFDPLPILINVLSESPYLRQESTSLYTILSEVYSNALEHGVLELESSLKSTPQGFAAYYELRKTKLASLSEGYVRFHFEHRVRPGGGKLRITVEDSGTGYNNAPTFFADNQPVSISHQGKLHQNYHGRGMALLDNICESVRVFPPGNKVEVEFVWALNEEESE